MNKEKFLENMHQHMYDLQESGEVTIGISHDDESPMLLFESWQGVHKMYTYLAIEAGVYDNYGPALDQMEKAPESYNRPKKAILTLIPGPEPVLFPDTYLDNEKEYRLIEHLRPFPEPLDEWIEAFEEIYGNLYDLVFSDEYSQCAECGKVIRTSPDSYSWQPDYVDTEYGYVHVDCIDVDDVLETHKNKEKALPPKIQARAINDGLLVELSDIEYENGMHPGMNDDPKIILKTMRKAHIDIWFNVEPSQFYVDFTVLVRPEDEENARTILENLDTYQGYDTAEEMSKALRGEHSDYYHMEKYEISPEDFIEGKFPK